jgi:hypothetical protein
MRSKISYVLKYTVLAASLAACGDSASITGPATDATPAKVADAATFVASAKTSVRPVHGPAQTNVSAAKVNFSRRTGYLVSSDRH